VNDDFRFRSTDDTVALRRDLQVLQGDLPITTSPPQARVYRDSNQSIPSGTPTAITFNQESYDNCGAHSTSADTSRLTAPIAGVYEIVGQFLFDSTGGGDRSGSIRLNGTTDIALLGTIGFTYAAAISQRISGSTQYRLEAGDYVELVASQATGAGRNVVASGEASPALMFVRLGSYGA
jgi:hypothetical protein